MVYSQQPVEQVVILDGQPQNPYCWHEVTAVLPGIGINSTWVNTDLPDSQI